MGVDYTILLGRLHTSQTGIKRTTKNRFWFQVDAVIELMWEGRELPEDLQETGDPCFFFAPTEGNKEVWQDCYGTKMHAVPIERLREAISELRLRLVEDQFDRLRMLDALLTSSPKWLTHFVIHCH